MNKGLKILIIAAIALALIMAGVILVKESGMDTAKVQEVYLEVITEEGNIERVMVEDSADVVFIKGCFSGDATSEGAASFREGGYRIILAQPDKEWHLYPYMGDLGQVKIGDSSSKYMMLDEKDSAELETVLNKYIDTNDYKDEYDWKQAIMEDIKN